MIRLRKECPEVGRGDWSLLPTRHRSVLALLHRLRRNTVLCLHNFAGEPHEV